MKVLIINSPLFRHKNPLYDEDSLPPIGLGYLATAIQESGVDVQLIDAVFERLPLDELVSIVSDSEPDFIAINIFTTNFELVKDLIAEIDKKIHCHFIIGGLSTRTLHKSILKWNIQNKLDVVFGDGESIVKDIVHDKVKESPDEIQGLKRFFKVDKQSIYFSNDISEVKLDRRFFKNEPVNHPFGFKEANIVTSRGCIFNCAFCAAANSLNRDLAIREKSTESIIDELSSINELYDDVTSIRVLDDLFLKSKHSIQKAIEVFSNFNYTWRSMAHVMTFKGVDLSTLKKLKGSGCSELFIGIESGSPRILRNIHKTPNIEVIKVNLSRVLEAGIGIKGYFIYGFPTESEEDFIMTYELAKYLKSKSIEFSAPFRTSVFQFRPYHGTELFHFIEEQLGEVPNVTNVEGNKDLSSLVGRIQFNFHSGNYSAESSDLVHKYIYKTTNLNDKDLFERKEVE